MIVNYGQFKEIFLFAQMNAILHWWAKQKNIFKTTTSTTCAAIVLRSDRSTEWEIRTPCRAQGIIIR